MLREDGAETRGRPGAPRSQTKREGPFREAPRREGVQSGSQAPASTLGGKRFTLSRPRPQCPVTKAPGHSYRWGGAEGMAGPSGEQNCLYLLPFGTKSGSTLYRAGLPQRRPRGRGVGPQVGSDPWGPQ